MSLLSKPWNDATKLSVFACFVYCSIAMIIQFLMIITFMNKVICKKKNDVNVSINNNGLIYLCFIVLIIYFLITCNDMICIICYVLTEDPKQLKFYHTFIAIEWNIAIILQYIFFIYRLWIVTLPKYRSKCTYIFIVMLIMIEILCRAIFYDDQFIGLAALTVFDLVVAIFILLIFYRLLHGILINNDEIMVRDRLSNTAMLDDNHLDRTMTEVRLSVGLGRTSISKHNNKDKVIEIFCEIFVLCGITLFINLLLGIVAFFRWYNFDSAGALWMEALWIMDISAQIVNSLSVYLQFKATIGCYFILCNKCHKCVQKLVTKRIYADSRFSVNRLN